VDTETRTEISPEGAIANVLGVMGIGDDGESVYFVAKGELAPGASAGEANMYLWHAGTTSYITTLSSEEGEAMPPFSVEGEAAGDWAPGLRARTAEVTPDGGAVVFMSVLSLTGYNNTYRNKEGNSVAVSEVYVYHAEDKQLTCVSCSRTGERPQENVDLVNGDSAGYLPVSWSNTRLQRWISDDGKRVFFDASVALVPHDTNGQQDVYEWESDGEGTCEEASGCVYLLSDGVDQTTASWLIDASENGNDVFFVTRAKLTPEDGTEADVLYDARVGGLQPPAPSTCTGTGCQGLPAAPPVFATPSTATFNGVGNFAPPTTVTSKVTKPLTKAQLLSRALRACKSKRQGKKRKTCEASARKRYGKQSHAGKSSKKGSKSSKGGK
jgi:hypothetical protein